MTGSAGAVAAPVAGEPIARVAERLAGELQVFAARLAAAAALVAL